MQGVDSNNRWFSCMCSFSWKLWSTFKICVRDSPGKASKIVEIRIPVQTTDNFKSSLYAFPVLLYSAFIRDCFCLIFGLLCLELFHSNKSYRCWFKYNWVVNCSALFYFILHFCYLLPIDHTLYKDYFV